MMSGHSHWATIKRQKGTADARRGQLFSKLVRSITVAAREGGVDADHNSKLRLAIEKARSENMPKDKIEAAIQKATGGGAGGAGQGLEELTLEGYGPGGVAVMIRAVTDNKNRTVSEMRSIFQRHGGSLGEQGSAAYVFENGSNEPTFTVPINEAGLAQQLVQLMQALEEQADVTETWANFDIAGELPAG